MSPTLKSISIKQYQPAVILSIYYISNIKNQLPNITSFDLVARNFILMKLRLLRFQSRRLNSKRSLNRHI